MKRIFFRLPVFYPLFLLFACSEDVSHVSTDRNEIPVSEAKFTSETPGTICGSEITWPVQDENGLVRGQAILCNDSLNLWVNLRLSKQIIFSSGRILAVQSGTSPSDVAGEHNWFILPVDGTDTASSRMFRMPLKKEWKQGDSLIVAFEATVRSNSGESFSGKVSLVQPSSEGVLPVVYGIQSCKPQFVSCPPQGIQAGDYRTYTAGDCIRLIPGTASPGDQGDWAFFTGTQLPPIRIGCRNACEFDTPADMKCYMASAETCGAGVKYAGLEKTEFSHELGREICALHCNIFLDQFSSDFNPSPLPLAQLLISRGPFTGWRVKDILEEAEMVFGHCASNYSAAQMAGVLRSVNENFAGTQTDKGFLNCAAL